MEICPFLPDPAGLACSRIEIGQGRIILELAANSPTAVCPACGQPSRRVQGSYTRMLADLPWMGQPVFLRLRVRRFCCDGSACPRTFAERLPLVAEVHARKTTRLSQALRQIGMALGGAAGSRLAGRLTMPASGDTLLRLVRRTVSEPVAAVGVLGVDDWAWRKGQRYGTVLCDLEQHRVVDLLPERSAEDLANWLTGHPGTQVISRDRGGIYAEGARTGAPQAVQVADRFHLVCNIREALVRLLDRHHQQIKEIAGSITVAQAPPPLPAEQEPLVSTQPADAPACQLPTSTVPQAEHPAFRAVTAIRNRIVSYWRGVSLPYPEPAIRLIRRDRIEPFNDQMTQCREELNQAVAELDRQFDELKDAARIRLGSLYNPADYPPTLADLFRVDWDFPSVQPPQYLLELNPALYEQERARMAARFQEAVKLAEEAFVSEFGKLVSHLVERLSGSVDGQNKVFRDSAVTQLGEFFSRFRELNVGSSPKLEELVALAQRAVRGVNPQELRDNDGLRQHIADKLSGVQGQLDGLMVDRPRRRILRPMSSPSSSKQAVA